MDGHTNWRWWLRNGPEARHPVQSVCKQSHLQSLAAEAVWSRGHWWDTQLLIPTFLSFLSSSWGTHLVTLPQVMSLPQSQGKQVSEGTQSRASSCPNPMKAHSSGGLCWDKVIETDISRPVPTSLVFHRQGLHLLLVVCVADRIFRGRITEARRE